MVGVACDSIVGRQWIFYRDLALLHLICGVFLLDHLGFKGFYQKRLSALCFVGEIGLVSICEILEYCSIMFYVDYMEGTQLMHF